MINEQLKYLEEERIKIWDRITELETSLNKKTSDYERDAKQASKKTSEFRNRSNEAKEQAENLLDEIKGIHVEVIQERETLKKLSSNITRYHNSASEKSTAISSNLDKTNRKKERLDKQIGEIKGIYDNQSNLVSQIDR